MNVTKITVDNRTVVRVMALVVAFFLSLAFLYWARHALTLLVLSFFLALALNPPVSYFASRMPKGSRVLGTAIAYLFVVAIIGAFLYAVVPPMIKQTNSLVDQLPRFVDRIQNEDGRVGDFIERYNIDGEVQDYVSNITSRLGDPDGILVNGIGVASGTIISTLTVLVMTFLMLIEGPAWIGKFWRLHSKARQEHHKALAAKMYKVVTGYVNGQLIIALLGAIAVLVMMLILRIPYAIPLAGLVGIFGLIPLIGTTLGSIIVIAVALFKSVSAAIVLAVFIIVYQQIENSVIQPYVQSKTLNMSPLLVFIAVVFGFSIGGLLAALLAIPIAGCLRVIVTDYIEHRHLGQDSPYRRGFGKTSAKTES